ncbi:TIGR03000 domain-containing protein [Gemmata sp. JC673]|uniref:TIGR03000 domain-containing protein n=1 Tax=Gemmata algarum TaxID=2975278 RepID=A0ABU5EUT6_9BACT|nr:TIGR03000 domain-containing protein [Gemmata algarum]MDY3558935.1 TIGR03000 domain-containing protein [Gemmata algarum]
MYSVVMMTALTAAPDAPGFNGYFRDLFFGNSCNGCNGCNGCSGGVRYSCYGGGCSGSVAYPASCSGCCGSSCNGGHVFGLGIGDRVRSFFERDSRTGCCGSHSYGCCGSHSYGCSGSSYSCSGYSCSGSAYSCFGGPAISYTPIVTGGLSCQGGLVYPAPPSFDSFPPSPVQPNIPYAEPRPAEATGLRPAAHAAPSATVANGQAARATVVVRLPADARLSAEGRELSLVGSERRFVSPELPRDQEFMYRFTAQYERDGKIVSVTEKVAVRAGATVSVEFTDLTARPTSSTAGTTTANGSGTPSAPVTEPTKAEPPVRDTPAAPTGPTNDRATITVKLPAGATLYVDDKKSPSKEAVRQFATPPLPANREFAYLLKAEIMRDGRPETLSQKVPFRAGERVTVDFTGLSK